jgi:hypothetical protein
MVDSRRDDAISEVIGFVLIIALIAIIASLYLTYVVPATGRDLEIAHMDIVQNQFLDYKSTVDSLWINNQYNTQVSSPFTLGTNPGSSQGSFVNMPLFQPVTSGGTMVVNGRDEVIGVTANALYDESPRTYVPSPLVQIEPNHLYVNFKTTDISKKATVKIKPDLGNWEAYLNTTPGPPTSLTITTYQNSSPIVTNLAIQNSIGTDNYTIDLANGAYGLKNLFVYPFNLNFPIQNNGTASIPTSYHPVTGATIIPDTSMGSLEFRSNNNYWIYQNYVYQYGGVFLVQDNGGIVKLLPSITITRDTHNPNLAQVTIHNITINKPTPSRVGGSSLVEVLTTLQQPYLATSLVIPQESGMPNAQNVNIVVKTGTDSTAALMWYDTFNKIKQTSQNNNVPASWINDPVVNTASIPMTVTWSIPGPTTAGDIYDIVLDPQNSVANIYLSPTSY